MKSHIMLDGIYGKEKRYENFLENMSHIYIKYITAQENWKEEFEKWKKPLNKETERLEKRMLILLKQAFERELNAGYVENFRNDCEPLENVGGEKKRKK